MSDRNALLASICATPADDTPRLVYADWLDENGDQPDDAVRAEFIRIQIELARRSGPPVKPKRPSVVGIMARVAVPPFVGVHAAQATMDRYKIEIKEYHRQRALPEREQSLLETFGPHWYMEFARPIFEPSGCATWSIEGPQPAGWMVCHGVECVQRNPFARGFIENFAATGSGWLECWKPVTRAQPIRRVTLTTIPAGNSHHDSRLAQHRRRVEFGLAVRSERRVLLPSRDQPPLVIRIAAARSCRRRHAEPRRSGRPVASARRRPAPQGDVAGYRVHILRDRSMIPGVTLEQLDALAARAPNRAVSLHPSRQHSPHTSSLTDVTERARRYLATIPPAVAGQRGHDRTFYAANRLVRGYALTPDAALPLLAEWNARCDPPWSEHDLLRKLEQAAKQPGPRGFLLTADPPPPGHHARKDGSAALQFRNYVWDEVPDGESSRRVKRGRDATEMLAEVLGFTGGWPRRIGKLLFVPAPNNQIGWVESANDLFAWLGTEFADGGRSGVDWTGGADCVTKQEFYAHCARTCESYESVELFPHAPQIAGAYYHHPEPAGGDGKALAKLMQFFEPETPEDYDLILAFFLTLFWGGPSGRRPLFVFEAAKTAANKGRGAGKSTVVQVAGKLVGGLISFDPGEQLRDIHARLLSPSARESRLVCFDNVKSLRFSSAGLEGLITSDTISGRQLFQGEGRRLNSITWSLTFNEPSLGQDLAQRSISIRVKTPVYYPEWEEQVTAHILEHRWAIVGDCLAKLAAPVTMPDDFKYTRWPVWEKQVLGQLPDPARLQALIVDRRGELDDDKRIGEELAASIMALVAERAKPRNPDSVCVLIPSEVLYREVVCKIKKDIATATHASRWLSNYPMPGLSKHDANVPYRGFVWRGNECPEDASYTTWADLPTASL